MDVCNPNNTLLEFRHAAIRHLAWLCSAPQLINAPSVFEPNRYLASNYFERLREWDRLPDTAPALLGQPPQRRLGFYFERLYEVLLSDLLGWKILLKNAQIQSNGHTLGELDFIVHNTTDDRIEHHEVAIKYYLGVPSPGGDALWYGPNARDRLDIKSDRLINHQSQRTHQPETLELLSSHGISGPLTARIFMPGYLFYPLNRPLAAPDMAPANHLRGWWAYTDELEQADTSSWVQLRKPHWVGPWCQAQRPATEETAQTLAMINEDRIPRLFSELGYDRSTKTWIECRRVFVVPPSWPS
ncbi:DUF1853 family protein [Marinobacter sp. M216]|uniref:DUF1853 family protein n=1 Tax=Marinobacter albus TaxID=3030833 RepID=A0ABT7HF74_9GAMM|nr:MULTISPECIES: DUF1853 family protein [unclassified Marinobacter]MBW7472472.1 DUF1853 family protein [Marinobacter sp. F4218]MDK9559022.1 DUF1853 family protein [Marinobacter sp. M216]